MKNLKINNEQINSVDEFQSLFNRKAIQDKS